MIALKNIDVVKGGRRLFENFSWKIQPGEHWVITGANGSGKTLLLEVLAGTTHVQKGEVTIDFINGESWDERYAERKRKIHYIPAHAIQNLIHQDQSLYYQQRYYGIGDERTPLVKDVLGNVMLDTLNLPETFDIQKLLNLEVTRLSNGQLKKVLLLKTLLTDIPEMLLLDYPFEGLDFDSRKDLCEFIDFMARQFLVQIVLVDHHHHVPTVMNRRLALHNFSIVKEANLSPVSAERPMLSPASTATASHQTPVVEIQDLMIRYGDTVILRGFNWTIKRGDRWALIGKNGAGKTTLFSMIFADHPMAYSQQIYLFGRRRGTGESIWDIKRRITYLGPELVSYLAPGGLLMSARQYMRTTAKNFREDFFETLLENFQAEEFIDTPVRVLSSGQLQLMLIMICFMEDRELLLLDEPFQFLDEQQRANLTRFLRLHVKEDTTLILITHYEQDLQAWTDHTMRL